MTAVPTDPADVVSVKVGEAEIVNGSAATWEDGENVLTVKVEDANASPARSTTYTVTVTKTEQSDANEGGEG